MSTLLLQIGAAVLALAGAPAALFLGVNLGERFAPRSSSRLRRLVPWAAGLLSGYLFAVLWFVAPVASRGDTVASTSVKVMPGPAQEAGVRTGDRVASVDGRPIRTWAELLVVLNKKASGKALDVTVEREGRSLSFAVTPVGRKIGITTIMERRSLPVMVTVLRAAGMPLQLLAELLALSDEPVGVVAVNETPAWQIALLRGGWVATLLGALGSVAYLFVVLFRRSQPARGVSQN